MSESRTQKPKPGGDGDRGAGPSGERPRRAWRRTLAAIGVVVGVCLGVVVTRAVWEGRAALADGDAAHEAGDSARAIARWRRAARWYVPGAPHVGDAYDRLEHLARQAEERGDLDTALSAWRGVRGSILATRSFYVPHADRLAPANRRIAALMARADDAALMTRADSAALDTEAERAAWHYDLLSRDESPSVGWTLLALLGLAMWLGGGFLFAWRGVTPDDRLVPAAAARAGALVAVGLFVWMLGLHQA
jgi:hypothetical protein